MAGQQLVTLQRAGVDDSDGKGLKTVAFYLPQFHPIPENDRWWGRGFTEWTNVARARPLYPGHNQPHLPADLGFYDLRLPETRVAQAEMAADHGIDAFCYYHYWFSGRRLLERPLDDMLASGEPGFGFCLCWANESWSRRWLGEERDILMKQIYSPEDDRQHARWLLNAFADPRYVRIGDRPLFLIYRPHDLPVPAATADVLRETAVRAGMAEPWLLGVDAHRPGEDYRQMGLDATLGFEPQLSVFSPHCFQDGRSGRRWLRNLCLGVNSPYLKLYDDGEARRRMHTIQRADGTVPCCYVGWDNTPRRGRNGIIYINGSPECFEAALREAVAAASEHPAHRRLVFINAWNEWAEGNHLEPDQRYGHAYLQAVARAVRSAEADSAIEHRGTQV